MQGTALYRNELVHILDTLTVPVGGGRLECLITYGGPVWVQFADLTDVRWTLEVAQ